jgi:hypothetical protein
MTCVDEILTPWTAALYVALVSYAEAPMKESLPHAALLYPQEAAVIVSVKGIGMQNGPVLAFSEVPTALFLAVDLRESFRFSGRLYLSLIGEGSTGFCVL